MTITWKLKRTAQCAKCPWLVGTDPLQISNGYCEKKHLALALCIAKPGDMSVVAGGPMHVMACHETNDAHCIGWLHHQLGRGNNIGLRLRMTTCENGASVRLRGEQHKSLEDTLP